MFVTKNKWAVEIEKVRELGLSGMTQTAIAEVYGVSKQCIKQVVDRYIPDWKENYGYAVHKKETMRNAFEKWGNKEDTDLYRAQRTKYHAKKYTALRTGYSWTVSFGELNFPKFCPVLGLELDYFAETRQENSPSFDRIDSSKGYDSGNVMVVSWRANRIKNDGTAEEHRKIADFLDSLPTT